jgi:hypothetical protein
MAVVVLLALASGAVALFGGIFGVLYLGIGARTRVTIISGVVATLTNCWYYWTFVEGLMGRNP